MQGPGGNACLERIRTAVGHYWQPEPRTSSSTPLKVTLAWTDPQGPAQTTGVENDSTARLVNDLDLRVYPPGTTIFDPSASTILDPDLANRTAAARGTAATTGDDTRNNLEQVVVSSPTTSDPYIVRVTAKNALKDNLGHSTSFQPVSLIMSSKVATALPFVVTGFYMLPDGKFVIDWNAVVGGEYFIAASDDLMTWTPLPGIFNANVENMTETVSPSGPHELLPEPVMSSS